MSKLLCSIGRCTAQESEKDSGSETYVGGCGNSIPTRISLRNHRIIVEIKEEISGDQLDKGLKIKKKEISYSAARVRNIFAKIAPYDFKLLGFTVTKPIDLLIETLAVAPPQIRPSI